MGITSAQIRGNKWLPIAKELVFELPFSALFCYLKYKIKYSEIRTFKLGKNPKQPRKTCGACLKNSVHGGIDNISTKSLLKDLTGAHGLTTRRPVARSWRDSFYVARLH